MSNMEQTYKRVLVGIDGSDHAFEAFKKAVEVARRNEGEVIVAAIIEQQLPTIMGMYPVGESFLEEESQRKNQLLDECLTYAQSVNFPSVKKVLTYGQPKNLLATELPRDYQIDLIMVGQSGLSQLEKMMIGSVASYVIRKAPCDVLVVSTPEENQ